MGANDHLYNRHHFATADTFRLTDEAAERYELDSATVYTVRAWANHYVPYGDYIYDPVRHAHGHPGYDSSLAPGLLLLEADGLDLAVYEYEVELVEAHTHAWRYEQGWLSGEPSRFCPGCCEREFYYCDDLEAEQEDDHA